MCLRRRKPTTARIGDEVLASLVGQLLCDGPCHPHTAERAAGAPETPGCGSAGTCSEPRPLRCWGERLLILLTDEL